MHSSTFVSAEEPHGSNQTPFPTSLRHCQFLYDHSADGFWVADQEGQFIAVNSAGCRLLGYTSEAYQRLQVTDLVRAEEFERLLELKHRLAAGETVTEVWEVRCAAGRYVSLLLTLSFTADGLWLAIGRESDQQHGQFNAAPNEALAELQQSVRITSTGLTRCSRDLRYLSANPAYAMMVGVPLERIVGAPIEAVLGADVFHKLRGPIERVLQGQRIEFEKEVLVFGQRRFLHAVYVPWEGRGGTVEGWLASITDVTALKHSEQALQSSERLYRATFDGAPVGIAHVGLDGRWLRFNDAVCKITGYERGALGARTFAQITHPDDVEKDWNQARAIIEGHIDTYSMEKRYIRPDASVVWVQLTVSGLRDDTGALLHFISVIEEITVRKTSADALRTAEARFRAITEAVPVLIWETEGMDATYANGYFLEFFGVDFNSIRGLGWSAFLHPEDSAEYLTFLNEVSRRREPFIYRCRFRRADGRYRWLQNIGQPIGASAFVGCSVDVTDMQSAQLEANAREQALLLADRHKDEFLATLAHELRAPLAAISNVSAFLSRVGEPGARTERPLAILKRQTLQLTRLVDDLLDSARIASGRIALDVKPIDVQTVVEQAVELVQPMIQEKSHRLDLDLGQERFYVQGDRARLAQALGNLLQNAAKYTDNGGEIRVAVHGTHREVVIEVRDNGTGMAPDFVPKVFELYMQSESTLDRSQGGLGIGLAVVKGLIEMHGGSVSGASAGIGQGSMFTLRLPRTFDIPVVDDALASQKLQAKRKVLIVDDNIDSADSLKLLLAQEGYEAHAVYGPREALEAAKGLQPEIILLDLGLPQMDGYEVARRIRSELKDGQACKLIALTGYGQSEDRRRTKEAGFDAHLLKPVHADVLHDVISGIASNLGDSDPTT